MLLHQRQWLATPDGDELYAVKVRLASNGSEFQVNIPVSGSATALLKNGAELPANVSPLSRWS